MARVAVSLQGPVRGERCGVAPESVAHEQSVNYSSWNDLAHAAYIVTEFPPSATLVRSKTCKGGGGRRGSKVIFL